MQKLFKRFATLAMALIMCLGLAVTVGTFTAEYVVADAAADGYYSGITAVKGKQLLGQLHDLIVTTHNKYTTYDDCKSSKVQQTDPGPNGGVMEFYTQQSIYTFSGTLGTWNREHVWCQSLSGGLWGTGGGGADMHHIRPSEGGLNSIRGNNKYGKVNGGKEAWSRDSNKNNVALGGHVGGGTFEPLDNVKGDVARIVMYVYTHYNNASNVGGTKESAKTRGNLPFTNVVTASNEAAAIQMLLDWNRLDPVDEIERHRNEKVYEIQGNRNPFIDNSSYAEAIWADGTATDPDPDDPPSQVELKGFALDSSAITLDIGQKCELKVIPSPSNAPARANWSSDNTAVATAVNGVITAKGAGTATVTATSTVNPAIKATATVTVVKSDASSAVITLQSFNKPGSYAFYDWSEGGMRGTAYIYGSGGSMQFNTSKPSYYLASTSPASGPIKSVTVTAAKGSADWKLLTSDTPYGEMKGKPENGNDRGTQAVTEEGATWTVSGNDTYFALTREGSGAAYLESIEVQFGGEASGDPDTLKEIIINPSAITLYEGTDKKLSVLSVPSTAGAQVEWTSSDESIATVSADGTVTAVKEGKATVTATSKADPAIKATATVTVIAEKTDPEPVEPDNPVLTGLNINPKSLSLTVGKTGSLKVTPVPANASAEVNWTSADESVATVDALGNVVALKKGTVKITATSKVNSSIKAEVSVTVTEPAGTVDTAKVEAFKNAVNAIPSDGSVVSARAAIKTAIDAYKVLSDADLAKVATEVQRLQSAVARLVEAYNALAQGSESSALNGII